MNYLDIATEKSIFADGIHDDTESIQNCLDKMKNGGTIHFPKGVYRITSTLIFYSNQHLDFDERARLVRSPKDKENITRYILASYSEPDTPGYDGTHDVKITGGIFDGNGSLTEKATLLNTVHCKNITVENCKFINGSEWHCIEFNSTENILVKGCVFDGPSYTAMRKNLTSELIQIDSPRTWTYGPVYDCREKLIDFLPDETPCKNVNIEHNLFRCDGFTAIGHHGNDAHTDIKISNNVFMGSSGKNGKSRGYITFLDLVSGVEIINNVFISVPEKTDLHYGIVTENQDITSCVAKNNSFFGYFDEYFIGGITYEDNNMSEWND